MGAPVRESDGGEPSKDQLSKDQLSKDQLSKNESSQDEPSRNGSSQNGSPKSESLKRESLKSDSIKNQVAKDQPKNTGAAPSSRAAQAPEPPWKRRTRRGIFEGDVAAVELRSRLALVPEPIREPAVRISTPAAATRLLGGVLMAAAAAGVAGYFWGFRLSTKSLELASASDQADVQPALSGKSLELVPASEPANVQAAPATRSPRLVSVSDQANVLHTPSTQAAAPERSSADSKPPATRTAAIGPAPDDVRGAANEVTSLGAVPRAAQPQTVLPSSASRPPVPAADPSEIAAKMKIGGDLMAHGDITAARMMFQRVAEAGEAAGAFALAETYDPVVLRPLRLRGGIAPDPALARSWYEKARDLGSSAAPERLARLTQISR